MNYILHGTPRVGIFLMIFYQFLISYSVNWGQPNLPYEESYFLHYCFRLAQIIGTFYLSIAACFTCLISGLLYSSYKNR